MKKLIYILLFVMLAITNNANAVTAPEDETILITSDPQFPCSQENCGYTPAQVKQNIINQYNNFNSTYPNALAVIADGDLTSFSHKEEVVESNKLFGILKIPLFLGLGNHDYFNNLNDCYENNCAVRGVMRMVTFERNNPKVYSTDLNFWHGYHFPSMQYNISGSLAYAANISEDIVLIQLNDRYSSCDGKTRPYHITSYVDGVFYADIGPDNYYIDIYNPNLEWLENTIKNARADNKIIIIGQHAHSPCQNVLDILDKYKVNLRFAGHSHWQIGQKFSTFYEDGATARGTYIRLNIHTTDEGERSAQIYANDPLGGRDEWLVKDMHLPNLWETKYHTVGYFAIMNYDYPDFNVVITYLDASGKNHSETVLLYNLGGYVVFNINSQGLIKYHGNYVQSIDFGSKGSGEWFHSVPSIQKGLFLGSLKYNSKLNRLYKVFDQFNSVGLSQHHNILSLAGFAGNSECVHMESDFEYDNKEAVVRMSLCK